MLSHGDESAAEIRTELELGTDSTEPVLIGNISTSIASTQTKVLDPRSNRRWLLDFLEFHPSTDWLKKFKLSYSCKFFRQTVDEREEISLSVSAPTDTQRHFHIHFIRRINWSSLLGFCQEWMKHPMNLALFIWLICVAISSSMLGLLLLGLLDNAFPAKSSRNHWIEINNQVLNALFTLMSLYQHPVLLNHFVLLCRWRSHDIITLRKTYCKNGDYRPHEWAHMMVVVTLLHITCFSQYALCGIYWGYERKHRPDFAENLFFALGIAAPVSAGAYTVYSPLGREYNSGSDEEVQIQVSNADFKQYDKLGLDLFDQRVVSRPQWAGGLFDCREDITVGFLSFFCIFCVFGWNMERLGFGNMYVHIVTFLLLCFAPFWIFNIAALKIHDKVVGDMVGVAGAVLCVFGLVYGGFWRIQMRKRFKLPENTLCCGSASLTDYIHWMFCWACSLAQEVRTGNFYDVEDESLYRKHSEGDEESQSLLCPLPREGGSNKLKRSDYGFSLPVSSQAESSNCTTDGKDPCCQDDLRHAEQKISSPLHPDYAMKPPVQPAITPPQNPSLVQTI